MSLQKVDMTAMKYFQSAAMQIEFCSGEPLRPLSTFHGKFDELFVQATDVPDSYLISIVKTRLDGAASQWSCRRHFQQKSLQVYGSESCSRRYTSWMNLSLRLAQG